MPRLRLAASNGQREPGWHLTLKQNPLHAHWVDQLRELWKMRERPAPPPRTNGPPMGPAEQQGYENLRIAIEIN